MYNKTKSINNASLIDNQRLNKGKLNISSNNTRYSSSNGSSNNSNNDSNFRNNSRNSNSIR